MENPTHSFKETNLVIYLIKESEIKSEAVMSWSSRKDNICGLSQCIVYNLSVTQEYTYFEISKNITSCTSSSRRHRT